MLNNLSETINVHKLFKHSIALYVASKHLDIKEDGDQVKSQRLMQEYLKAKEKANYSAIVNDTNQTIKII